MGAFEEEDNKHSYNSNLKIGKKETISQKRESLEDQVIAYRNDQNKLYNDIATASKEYASAINDKTLEENKSQLSKSLENELIQKLQGYATLLNSDESQPESVGSTGLCVLLMRLLYKQRNRINELEYRISRLEK